MDDLRRDLESLENPKTKKTLLEEKRILSLEKDGETYKLSYKREGLDLPEKKELEEAFYGVFKNHGIHEDHLLIMSHASPASSPQKEVEKAKLSVGHSRPPKEKRSVDGVKKLLAVASGKGGVGKSTVSVNLALSLMKKGKRVGLLDGDIYGPSLPTMLGKKGERPRGEGKTILPLMFRDMPFVSFGPFVKEREPVIWRGPMLGGVLNQFLFDVRWGQLDILLVDLPPGTGDMQLSLVQSAKIDGVIVVTTPGEVALVDSIKGLKMFEQLQVPILGLVENMSYFVCQECGHKHNLFGLDGGKKTASELAIPFLGPIPLEGKLRDSGDRGHPYMAEENLKGTAVWKSYMAIADNVDKIVFGRQGFFKKIFSPC